MSANGPALLAAAAGVGFAHAILPDHWVPLAMLGRTRRYRLAQVARLSGLAGVAHVLVSIVLGAVIVVVGLQFRAAIQGAQDLIVGLLLIVTGVGFAGVELTGHRHDRPHRHHHHHHEDHHHDDDDVRASQPHPHREHPHFHRHPHPHSDRLHRQRPRGGALAVGSRSRLGGLAAVMVPFGATASPDLTILPVFLAATTAGVGIAVGSLAIFAAVTIGTIVGLTLVAAHGGYQIRGRWLERWGNSLTALILVVIGALVLTGTI
jgi:nickel/cobalt exporter